MPGVHWNDLQIDMLKEAVANGIPLDELEVEEKTSHAIRRKAVRLKLVPKSGRKHIWETEEKRRLKELVAQGLSAREIAKRKLLPRFSRHAIQKQMGRLRVVNRKRSEYGKAAQRLSRETRERLITFIRSYAKACSAPEIAELWNAAHTPKVTARKVRSLISQKKIKRNARKIFRTEYCSRRRKKGQQSESALRGRSRRWEKYWRQARASLASAAQARILEAADAEEPLELRECRHCRLQLPAEAPFFVGRRMNVAIGTPAPKKSKLCCVCRRSSAAKTG